MINFRSQDQTRSLPTVQVIPLIDILFVNLSFFMAMFLHFNFESQLNIAVPQASSSVEAKTAFQEIVINILRDGTTIVNEKKFTHPELTALLERTAQIYPGQSIVVRADEKTYHEYVVGVLDSCAKAKIWNISFATTKSLSKEQ